MALPGMRPSGPFAELVVVSRAVCTIQGLALSNALRLGLVGWAKTWRASRASMQTGQLPGAGTLATVRVAELDRRAARLVRTESDDVERHLASTIRPDVTGNPRSSPPLRRFCQHASFLHNGWHHPCDGGMILSVSNYGLAWSTLTVAVVRDPICAKSPSCQQTRSCRSLLSESPPNAPSPPVRP